MQNQPKNNQKNISVSVEEAISQKTNKPYEYIKVVVGDWEERVFPRSKFDIKYIKEYLKDAPKD